jgi:hypothetical protein
LKVRSAWKNDWDRVGDWQGERTLEIPEVLVGAVALEGKSSKSMDALLAISEEPTRWKVKGTETNKQIRKGHLST